MGQYKLDKTLKAFAADEDEQIQLTLATCFHELAIMLAGSSHKYLAEILMTMLNSDSEPILCAIYSNLGDILLNFNIGGDSSTNPNTKQVRDLKKQKDLTNSKGFIHGKCLLGNY